MLPPSLEGDNVTWQWVPFWSQVLWLLCRRKSNIWWTCIFFIWKESWGLQVFFKPIYEWLQKYSQIWEIISGINVNKAYHASNGRIKEQLKDVYCLTSLLQAHLHLDLYQVQNVVRKRMEQNIVVVSIKPQPLNHKQLQLKSQKVVNVEDTLTKLLHQQESGMAKKLIQWEILGLFTWKQCM